MRMHTAPFLLKELKLEVTHVCHLQCIHCSSLAGAECTRQMKWDDFKRIIDEAHKLNVEEITISGGEPLCWQSLPRAVRYIVKLKMKLTLYTTGIAPNAISILGELRVAGLSRVIFSIYGGSRQHHEDVTLTRGSFAGTVNAVKKCLGLGFKVEFHFVPMSSNYLALRSVVGLAHTLGVDRVSVLRLVPQGRGSEYEKLQLSKNANSSLRQTIFDLAKEGHDIRVGSPYNILMLNANPECCAGIDRLTVSPDLRIAPCDAFKQITPQMVGIANDFSCLGQNSLGDCWAKSPYLGKIREFLTTPFADECLSCRVLNNCLSGCVAQKFHFYGMLAKLPDPMCLRVQP